MLKISSDDKGNPIAVISLYSYQPVGSGEQLWLIGSGPIVGETAFVEMFVTNGGQFGADFDPADVVEQHWEQIGLHFLDCDNTVLFYTANDSSFGDGQLNLSRLLRGLIDLVGACH